MSTSVGVPPSFPFYPLVPPDRPALALHCVLPESFFTLRRLACGRREAASSRPSLPEQQAGSATAAGSLDVN